MLNPPQNLNVQPKLWCFIFVHQFWFLLYVWSQNAFVRLGNPRKNKLSPRLNLWHAMHSNTRNQKCSKFSFLCEIVLSVVFKYRKYIILIQHFVSYEKALKRHLQPQCFARRGRHLRLHVNSVFRSSEFNPSEFSGIRSQDIAKSPNNIV